MIREALASDFDDVIRLYRQLVPQEPVLQDGSDAAVFEHILRTPGLQLFVVDLDDVVVATAYLSVIPDITRSALPYAVIDNVIVDDRSRGLGLGKQLIADTLDVAWEAGCYKAVLLTGSRDPGTHAFYEACGFSRHEKTAYVARPS